MANVLNNSVTMSLEDYDNLNEVIDELTDRNDNLKNALEELKKADGQRIIIHEYYFDEDEECFDEEVAVCGFEDVREEVEKFYKDNFNHLKSELKKARELVKKTAQENLQLQMDIEKLKNRSLWNRIINK